MAVAAAVIMGGITSIQSLPLALGLAWLPHTYKLYVLERSIGYDNVAPRHWEEREALRGKPKVKALLRALTGAHTNGLETFSAFAAAVLAAKVTNVPSDVADPLARFFLVARCVSAALLPQSLPWAALGPPRADTNRLTLCGLHTRVARRVVYTLFYVKQGQSVPLSAGRTAAFLASMAAPALLFLRAAQAPAK